MLWSLGRKRMVQRTCLDCGETWTLEASLARLRARRPRGYPAGFRSFPVGTAGLQGGRASQAMAEQQVAEAQAGLDQELETIRQARTCRSAVARATKTDG